MADRQHNHKFVKHIRVFRFLLVVDIRRVAYGPPLDDVFNQFATAVARTFVVI